MNTSKKILLSLLATILILLVFNFLTFYNCEYDSYLFKKFNFDKEKNIPSIFSFLLLLTSSIFLFRISLKKIKPSTLFWGSLSFIFFFLSLDELLRIHEKIGKSVGKHIESKGVFTYEWLIPYYLFFYYYFTQNLYLVHQKRREIT